jgi:hypothetical protein
MLPASWPGLAAVATAAVRNPGTTDGVPHVTLSCEQPAP